MATAMAAPAPASPAAARASPDVSRPVQPSAVSTTAGPFRPAVPAKIVIGTPQNPRRSAPGEPVGHWSPQPRLWFKARDADSLSGQGAAAIAGACARFG